MRWVLILLLTLNVCYLLWESLQSAPERDSHPELPAAPRVELLDEVSEGGAVPAASGVSDDEDPVGDESTPVAGSARCARIGPFPDPQARSAFAQTLDSGLPLESRSSERVMETLYRTYLPPYPDREAAVEANEELRQALEEQDLAIDSFVINSGELNDGISLGLFGQQENARAVQQRMQALEYPVRIREEPRSETDFWLLARGGDTVTELTQRWSQLSAGDDSLQLTENLCETIAPESDFP